MPDVDEIGIHVRRLSVAACDKERGPSDEEESLALRQWRGASEIVPMPNFAGIRLIITSQIILDCFDSSLHIQLETELEAPVDLSTISLGAPLNYRRVRESYSLKVFDFIGQLRGLPTSNKEDCRDICAKSKVTSRRALNCQR